MMKVLLMALALGCSVEAFKVSSPALKPAVAKLPSLDTALALRGGGMVDQGICARALRSNAELSLSLWAELGRSRWRAQWQG